jgi:hypothetical protein
MSKREELEQLERDDLEDAARQAGVARPEVLTRDEILDAIEALEERASGSREGSKGFLGRMRQVLAAFVERGLNLPEAAERIRSGGGAAPPPEPAMLPTVTLAEIYAAQGHTERALAVLDQILRSEPEHPGALRLRAKLRGQPSPLPPDEDDEDEDDVDESPPAPAPPAINAPSSASLIAPPPATEEPPAEATAQEVPPTPEAIAEEAPPPAGPPRPAPMLDEEPLPERYDVDELVLMPVDPTTLYLYWELRPETLNEALQLEPEGQLLLRLDRVIGEDYQTLRRLPVTFLGDTQIDNLPPGALCVAVLGLRSESQWIPLLRSIPRALPPAGGVVEVAHRVVRWSDEPTEEPPPPPPPTFALAVAIRAPVVLPTAAPATTPDPSLPDLSGPPGLPLLPLLPSFPGATPPAAPPAPSPSPLGSSERWAMPPGWSPHAPSGPPLGASERLLGSR